ncbi:hypothetical protein CsatB_006736 [Cannabis sativa]
MLTKRVMFIIWSVSTCSSHWPKFLYSLIIFVILLKIWLELAGKFNEIVDTEIREEFRGIENVREEQEQQLEDFLKLGLRCIEAIREDRPLMIQVSKELKRIERSI